MKIGQETGFTTKATVGTEYQMGMYINSEAGNGRNWKKLMFFMSIPGTGGVIHSGILIITPMTVFILVIITGMAVGTDLDIGIDPFLKSYIPTKCLALLKKDSVPFSIRTIKTVVLSGPPRLLAISTSFFVI
jgi:hypothetical protein